MSIKIRVIFYMTRIIKTILFQFYILNLNAIYIQLPYVLICIGSNPDPHYNEKLFLSRS
jgi:hypothetical protein